MVVSNAAAAQLPLEFLWGEELEFKPKKAIPNFEDGKP